MRENARNTRKAEIPRRAGSERRTDFIRVDELPDEAVRTDSQTPPAIAG